MKKQLLVLLMFSVNTLFSQLPNDCVNSIVVCGNSTIDLDVNGIGVQELFNSNNCQSQENNTIWFKVTVATAGTLGFTLTPNSTDISEDYDFFVFGPNTSCDNLGFAIRCSTTNPANANQGNNLTGMKDLADDETSEGPGSDGDSFVEWLNVQADETYYFVIDRPIGNSPFSLDWIGTATFYNAPNNQMPATMSMDLEECDNNANGYTNFNLRQKEDLIIGNQDVTASYYTNFSDAQIANAPIFLNTNYNSNSKTIYLRLTDNVTGCFSIYDFQIIVLANIAIPSLNNLEICETNSDGYANFDLSQNNEIVAQLAPNYTVNYYLTQNNANNSQNPLPLNYTNTSNPQTVWMRFGNLDTGCYGVASFELSVSEIPMLNQIDNWSACDEDQDGFYEFDLTNLIPEILGNQSENNFSIMFYSTLDDLNNNENGLPMLYTNEDAFTTEEIFYKILRNNSNCFQFSSFFINVLDKPISNQIDDWKVCDEDANGVYEFDLSSLKQQILGDQNENDFDVNFYLSQDDAENHLNQLPELYTNTNLEETIFYRVENKQLIDCYSVASFNIRVFNKPVFTQIPDWVVCDDDGYYEFNLESIKTTLIDNQNNQEVAVSFYQSYVDATYLITPFDLHYTNKEKFEREEIFVRLENTVIEDCYTIGSFFIEPVRKPIFDVDEDVKYKCVNEPLQTVVFSIAEFEGDYTYSWIDNVGNELSNSDTLLATDIGSYFITATTTDGNFCSATKEVHLLPAESATIVDFSIQEYWEKDNFSIAISVFGSGIYQFAIDNINDSYQDDPIITNVSLGWHTIFVKEMNGCGVVSKEIFVLGFKKFFTPNNDGVNDVWEVKGIQFKHNDVITIFNRYGKIMYRFKPFSEQGWNGYFNGKLAPEDDYWFTAIMDDQKRERYIRKGHFSLVLTK